MDKHAEQESLEKNMVLCSALIQFWQSCCGYAVQAILPYSYPCRLLHEFVQQLECESHGKYMSKSEYLGNPSPIVIGGEGTLVQHSLFQYFQQSSHVIPIQFVGFRQSNLSEGVVQQKQLNTHLIAQMYSLAFGDTFNLTSEKFDGKRPSTALIADSLTPFNLGALIAYYENLVMFVGFLMDVNSFDQPGVELGKQMSKNMMDGKLQNSILDVLQDQFSI